MGCFQLQRGSNGLGFFFIEKSSNYNSPWGSIFQGGSTFSRGVGVQLAYSYRTCECDLPWCWGPDPLTPMEGSGETARLHK